jgi:TPR repeat protein
MGDRINVITRLCCALILAGAIVLPGIARADLKTGVTAYKAGDYKAAHREFTKLAKDGNANAQFNLGILYLTGRGVERDLAKSVEWHLKAAAQDLPAASHGLGVLYYQGNGVKQDYAQALKWFRRAAARGFADSEFNIGVMYFNRQGVKRDDIEVVKWVTLAAARKFAPAEYRMGQMYEKGVIFAEDPVAALHWYRLAEAHGDKNAPAARARVAKALNLPDRPTPRAATPAAAAKSVPKPAQNAAVPPQTPEIPPETPVATPTPPEDIQPAAADEGSSDTFAVTPTGRKIRPETIPQPASITEPPSRPKPTASEEPAPPVKSEQHSPPGGREWWVQFASFRTVAEAERAWQTLLRRADAAIGDVPRIVARADLGNRGVYHRLQAGPLRDQKAAADLCRRVHESLPGQGCLPVRVRTR